MKKRAVPSLGGLILAVIAFCLPALSQGAAADSMPGADRTVSVVIDGSLPGFTQDQLSAYVAEQMTAADVAAWKFAVAPASGAQPSNRIVWHFKLLPFAGGSIRYIGPVLSKARETFGVGRAVGIDVKIYLNGQYQASTFDQVTIKGGPNDPNLDGAIQKVTRTIVSDALTQEDATDAPKLAVSSTVRIG